MLFVAIAVILLSLSPHARGQAVQDAAAATQADPQAAVVRRPVVRPVVVPSVTVTAFTPTAATVGSTVMVTGTNLQLVTSVTIGNAAATFTTSATRLDLVVPAGAQSAPISLSGTGFKVTTSQSLTILGSPVVAQVSAVNTPVNATFTITGTALDQVSRFEIGTTVLTASNRTATGATLQMPATPVTGLLAMVLADNSRIVTAFQLTAYVPLAITSFTPSQGAIGGTVTISGTGLNNVGSVQFTGAAAQAVTPGSATSLAVTVPNGATSGVITLTTPFESKATATVFTVVPKVVVLSFNASTTATGVTITITGTGLSTVTAATIGGIAATIGTRTDTQIVITGGATAEGEVILIATTGNVVAGSFMRNANAAITVSHLEFAQMYGRDSADGSQRLNAGRPISVRAFVLGQQSGVAAPTVTVTGSRSGASLGTLAMTGPSTLPISVQRYVIGSSFHAVLPVSWAQPGVTVRVDVTPSGGSTMSLTAAPNIVNPARIHISLVPITVGSRTAVVPAHATVRQMLTRAFPYASGDIVLDTHAPMVVPGLTQVSDADWGTILGQLEELRLNENARNKLYFGLIPTAARTGGVAGIGYVPRLSQAGSTGVAFSSLGYDSGANEAPSDPFGVVQPRWAPVMIHEMGHNHSRPHAPCGSAGSPDPAYPYPGGNFGTDPLWDIQSGLVTGPTYTLGTSTTIRQMKDVMGYCSGSFFSDYNYAIVQQFAEARTGTFPQPIVAASMAAAVATSRADAVASGGYLLVSGEISADGVRMNPPVAVSGHLPVPAPTANPDYRLRVRTARQQRLAVAVDAVEVADLPGETVRHFHALVPNPGDIDAIDVEQRGRVLPHRAVGGRPARVARQLSAAGAGQRLQWRETGGRLRLDWDAASQPFASVTHVAVDGTRRVIAQRLVGGVAEVDTRGLPAGGRFELSVGDERGARLTEIRR
jgi:hypothetical protein